MSKYKKNKAVALRYNVDEDTSPVVIASGYGTVAEHIIDIAELRNQAFKYSYIGFRTIQMESQFLSRHHKLGFHLTHPRHIKGYEHMDMTALPASRLPIPAFVLGIYPQFGKCLHSLVIHRYHKVQERRVVAWG